MGFRPQPTIYNIDFDEDSPLHGLHMRASCCTLDQYDTMLRNSSGAGDDITISKLIETNDWIVKLFADHLVSWDLEDYITGEPVPATLDAIKSQERGLIVEAIAAWQIAIVSVPKRLNKTSSSGETLEEQSLGLGSASESLPNWNKPS